MATARESVDYLHLTCTLQPSTSSCTLLRRHCPTLDIQHSYTTGISIVELEHLGQPTKEAQLL